MTKILVFARFGGFLTGFTLKIIICVRDWGMFLRNGG